MPKEIGKHRYFLLNKPYGYLCQFTGEKNDQLLGDLYDFPKDVYSVGRLDKDSEGLLLLTNDNSFKTKLLDPESKVKKTYMVQLDGDVSDEAIDLLQSGSIVIKHKGKEHRVAKAKCRRIGTPEFQERIPPIRYRKNIPTSWIELTITEGKNRQVRKMTAAVGFPTLRLIRYAIDVYSIEKLDSGEVKEFVPFN